MIESSPSALQDLRRVTSEALPGVLAGLKREDPVVVLQAQLGQIGELSAVVWPEPNPQLPWAEAMEDQALQVLHHRLGVASWHVYGPAGDSLRRSVHPAVPPSQRPVLALVSPLPPERSGISDYTAALLAPLSRHYQLVLLHEDPALLEPQHDAWGQPLPAHSLAWLDSAEAEGVRLLYHFGNSHYHEAMLHCIGRHPGVVVLHDYYLSHLIDGWARHGEQAPSLQALLYRCHGYPALREYSRERPRGGHSHLWSWSLNQPVLQAARGVLVHSRHSLNLAQRDYRPSSFANWHQVPMLSRAPQPVSSQALEAVRQRYGLGPEAKLICSFGYVGPAKLSLELIEAFARSGLGRQGWSLILAGSDGGNTAYRRTLDQAIAAGSLQGRVHVTGWIDPEVYWCLQSLSTINVQLRSRSRGETSAAVMDCLQSGAGLIVNRHGSLDDLPDEVCRKVPDRFTTHQLAACLQSLAGDPQARVQLGQHGRRLCLEQHSPEVCAEAYRAAIEAIHACGSHRLDVALALGNEPGFRTQKRRQRAAWINGLAERLPAQPAPRRLYVDVSAIAEHDLGTGIQRVTSCLCRELFSQMPDGWIVEPVQASPGDPGYRTAPAYSGALLGIPESLLPPPEPVLPGEGDLFLGLDLHHAVVEAQADWYGWIKARGAETWFVVYDLLPCRLPECFPPGTDELHRRWLLTITRATGSVCISCAVADDLSAWIREHRQGLDDDGIHQVRWFHQGSDLPVAQASRAHPRHERPVPEPNRSLNLLMVGTVEPRKGYLQVLQAMQLLWQREIPLNLTIVGREGWRGLPDDQRRSLPETLALLQQLGRRYPQQLRWLNGASDEELLAEYARADALLAASYGEGFGLPLVEARQNGLAVIARDLPVFREVMADDAEYFVADAVEQLADWLEGWSCREPSKRLRDSRPSLAAVGEQCAGFTWRQSCAQLLQALAISSDAAAEGGARPANR